MDLSKKPSEEQAQPASNRAQAQAQATLASPLFGYYSIPRSLSPPHLEAPFKAKCFKCDRHLDRLSDFLRLVTLIPQHLSMGFFPGIILLSLAVTFTCQLSSVQSQPSTVDTFQKLVAAVELANTNAKECGGQRTCLGKEVVTQITANIILSGPLPGLMGGAHLNIVGNCPNEEGGRCTIDGADQFAVFTFNGSMPYQSSPPGLLVLSSLRFIRAKNGVLSNAWTAVNASHVTFANNTGGAVSSVGFMGGSPLHSYDNCQFSHNSGGAIRGGSSKYGLAKDQYGFIVRNCTFEGNTARERENGGAVGLMGLGKAQFDNVTFAGNSASTGKGGAVYLDETEVLFRNAKFLGNSAAQGGNAVYGACGVYNNATIRFCSSEFQEHESETQNSPDLLFESPGIGTISVYFCETDIPEGSVLPERFEGTVGEGSGELCKSEYCKL